MCDFSGHVFDIDVDFSGYVFPGDANFGLRPQSDTPVFFNKTANFSQVTFLSSAQFWNAHFLQKADFSKTRFNGPVRFANAVFQRRVNFISAHFLNTVRFGGAECNDWARFEGAIFHEEVRFESSQFVWAEFSNVTFRGDVFFLGAKFKTLAYFPRARFLGTNVDFSGVISHGVFYLRDVHFEKVPDFVQANFDQAPNLDNVSLPLPWILWKGQKRNIANYRTLRRLANQGHDYEREQWFAKGELRSRRLTDDTPLAPAFWLGVAYDLFSDCGHSLLRPLLAWLCCIVIFAIYFLGQNAEMTELRDASAANGFIRRVAAYATTAWNAASGELSVSCVSRTQNGITGLAKPVRDRTNPVNEALSIAYHNAVIVLDSSGDSFHRAFGCLYGVERYGGNPVAHVPRSVAIASGIQKLLSAIFIFLFGLAVRNMLKVK